MPREVTPGRRSRRVEIWKAAHSGRRARQFERRDADRLCARHGCRRPTPPGSRPRRPGGQTSRPSSLWFADLPAPRTRRRTLRFPESSAGRGCRGHSTPSRRGPPAASGSRLWPLAAAAAAAVLVWQVVAVPFISGPGAGEARYAPVSEQPAAGSTVSVAFVPTASEAAIRALLAETGARISDGPSAIAWHSASPTTRPGMPDLSSSRPRTSSKARKRTSNRRSDDPECRKAMHQQTLEPRTRDITCVLARTQIEAGVGAASPGASAPTLLWGGGGSQRPLTCGVPELTGRCRCRRAGAGCPAPSRTGSGRHGGGRVCGAPDTSRAMRAIRGLRWSLSSSRWTRSSIPGCGSRSRRIRRRSTPAAVWRRCWRIPSSSTSRTSTWRSSLTTGSCTGATWRGSCCRCSTRPPAR